MTCTCGYNNTPLPGDKPPVNCEGCGIPLRPPDDHKRPYPTVFPDEGPRTVTDWDRETYPALEGVVIIKTADVNWGRGIGAECYGYYTKKFVGVVDLETFEHNREEVPDNCPECGSNRAIYRHGFDGCVASYVALECGTCDRTHFERFDC